MKLPPVEKLIDYTFIVCAVLLTYLLFAPLVHGAETLRCTATSPSPEIDSFQMHCDVVRDCVGVWGEWRTVFDTGTNCPGDGMRRIVVQTREFTITTPPVNGGASCPTTETRHLTQHCIFN